MTRFCKAFDSVTSWSSLIKTWVDAKPDDLMDTRFSMYAQASETNERTVKAFSYLGVYCIDIGLDSGDTSLTI